MLENLTIVQNAGAMARHSTERQKLISENSANLDTPGYQVRDLEAFTINDQVVRRPEPLFVTIRW